jgi:valyl-tRNA synthetase
MFDKPYDPKTVERSIYERWRISGYFDPDKLPGNRAETYVVYMPLPNVTGSLHMGHALDNTLPDALIRYLRMRGLRTLWLPGTDHAGIATQYVVEKELKKQGISRFSLGREQFIEKVWEWKREYGNRIYSQLERLGCSADWSRARFTMDEAYAKDVAHAFLHYHERGLLYRGERTVHWCTRCGTSLSELELEYRDETFSLWFIRYSDAITVATTRPETMLGDTAVAVHPDDARYRALVGTTVTLPLVGRTLPVVADEFVDPLFGTGAVKITPAHDLADFEMATRHGIPSIQVIDARGKMTDAAGAEYAGLSAKEVREKVVASLEASGALVKREDYPHRVAVCYRCGHVIEPIPSAQWFLKMDELATKALEAVRSGKVRISPENFRKVYEDWLRNIRDWTVSRQIWWGHRLPVWFCKKELVVVSGSSGSYRGAEVFKDEERKKTIHTEFTNNYVVAEKKPARCPFCNECEMEQSPDVLDTWFSSALWPFAGLSKKDLDRYYPGNLVTNARDILNLWDARMIYSGLEFMGEVPFRDVVIHGTIQTKDGKRMSKSLGTGIDPMRYIEEYGADATRFAVLWQATGQDIRWDETTVVAGRKFLNKIWNAARFVLTNLEGAPDGGAPEPRTDADRAALAALAHARASVEHHLPAFDASHALRDAYEFFWHRFCDEYLEAAKLQLKDGVLRAPTQGMLRHLLMESLKLLHPFLPFVTERIWSELRGEAPENMLMVARW